MSLPRKNLMRIRLKKIKKVHLKKEKKQKKNKLLLLTKKAQKPKICLQLKRIKKRDRVKQRN
jgi:hypothetical protein